ncbi:MAG: hypothetical protein M1820_003069 [Bogoriella megaspora]|nr:MAG: hypothetical protein M1820_003069 [Bogoriella megaspora]
MQSQQHPFDQALSDFAKDLTRQEQEEFRFTRLSDLQVAVSRIQTKHDMDRKQRGLDRLSGFLEVMEQYGRVIEVFGNSSPFVGFVWTTRNDVHAFEAVVDFYRQIGENLPQFEKYETLFREDEAMRSVLQWVFTDILEFHRKAFKFFKQKLWLRIFQATWKTFNNRFTRVVDNLKRHKALLETQASLAQVQQSQAEWKKSEERFAKEREDEERRRRDYLVGWLSAADPKLFQEQGIKTRKKYPGSGRWLFSRSVFRDWFHSRICPRPLLCMVGNPGAGKTVLASMIIEEAQSAQSSCSSTIYFYFKHHDPDRNTFLGLARSLLQQLLIGNQESMDGELLDRGVLDYLYTEASSSGKPTLSSAALAKDLLSTCLHNNGDIYVIIDGIDECSKAEHSDILNWFREEFGAFIDHDDVNIRCLLIGQEVRRKSGASVPTLKIRPSDMRGDIRAFNKAEADKIQRKFKKLSPREVKDLVDDISERSNGMFLYAKLVMENLFWQTTFADFKHERNPSRLPEDIFQAYDRIFHRIFADRSEPGQKQQQKYALRLLGWLACASRPFYWREIQGAMAIDVDKHEVNTDLHLEVHSKDLCGSLVDILPGYLIQLVHPTACEALIHHGYVDPRNTHLDLARLSTSYLTFESFTPSQTDRDVENLALEGYYAFQDYALVHWMDHLTKGLPGLEGYLESVKLFESLRKFLPRLVAAYHRTEPSDSTSVACFHEMRGYDIHPLLVDAFVAFNNKKMSLLEFASAESLYATISRIRSVLETIDARRHAKIASFYGPKLFKCHHLKCRAFYEGFESEDIRKMHVTNHDKPFLCAYDGCPKGVTGFSSKKELQKHIDNIHTQMTLADDEFPDMQDLEEALMRSPEKSPEVIESPPMEEPTPAEENHSPPTQPDPKPKAPVSARPARRRQTFRIEKRGIAERQKHPAKFLCSRCPKKFTRMYNLRAHERAHMDLKPFKCTICRASFARENDRKRHERGHNRNMEHVCYGQLADGLNWGCGRKFARKDELRSHWQTLAGQECARSKDEGGVEVDHREPAQNSIDPMNSIMSSSLATGGIYELPGIDSSAADFINAPESTRTLPSISSLLGPHEEFADTQCGNAAKSADDTRGTIQSRNLEMIGHSTRMDLDEECFGTSQGTNTWQSGY